MLLIIIIQIIQINTINITYYPTDSQLYQPQLCIKRNKNREQKEWIETIFILSENGRIYKSIDNGYIWNDETIIIEKQNINDWYYELQIPPANKEIIYIFGRNGTGIYSQNCGENYQIFNYPQDLQDFKLNSMDDQWLLAYQNCNRCYAPYNKNLYKSNDGGKNWEWILTDVMQVTWDKLIDSDLIPDQRIIACHLEYNQSRVSYSDDYYKTYHIIHNNGTGFFQTQFHMFVISKYQQYFKLHVSPAFYDYADMLNVSIPIEQQYSYTLLDTESEQIFLSISHNQTNKKLTHIYSSDYQGFKFTISLLNNVRSLDNGQCDFEKIESLRGVYIANIYDHEKINNVKNIDQYKKTVITYDKGGIWHQLKVPKYDSNGKEIICQGDCSLHLQGRSISKIYREQKAIGLILASGNIGLYLDDKIINTYFSRDGGQTWYEVKQGHHIYSFGDRGGIIVMAKAKQLTDELIYSWDEGLTWEIVKIQKKMIITSIISRSLYINFIITGIDEKRKGIIINIDFTTLHKRTCSGIWDPTAPESDYEFWIPKNYENGKCFFGQKFRYTRRKRDAQCFNQQDHDKIHYIDTCECTNEDWECDYGFYRKINGGSCIPIAQLFEEDQYIDILKPPINCTGTYMQSQGYRKVIGDFCQGGVDLDPIEIPCENGLEQSLNTQIPKLPQMSIKEEQKLLIEQETKQTLNQQQQQNNTFNYKIIAQIIIILFVISVLILLVIKFFKGQQNEQKQQTFYQLKKFGENTGLLNDDDGI